MPRFPLVLALLLPFVAAGQEIKIGSSGVGGTHEALKVPLNAVVHVLLPSGQVALIQFTSIGNGTAEYRWKYRRAPGVQVSSGSGTLVERYQSIPAGESPPVLVDTLSGHNVTVRAGEILAEWSTGGERYCYFYFDSKLARAKILEAAAYERNL
jgi:hypothetical protein